MTTITIAAPHDGYYRVNGKPYVRVTTALSIIRDPFLERWRGDVGNAEADQRRDDGAELGSLIHGLIADGRDNETFAYDTINRMLGAYREWKALCVEQVIGVEQRVAHHDYQYAGTYDQKVVIKGDSLPSIIDIKTGQLSPVMGLQLAAYAEADEEKIARRIVLQLGKGERAGKWATKECTDPADFRRFTYALDLYRWKEQAK